MAKTLYPRTHQRATAMFGIFDFGTTASTPAPSPSSEPKSNNTDRCRSDSPFQPMQMPSSDDLWLLPSLSGRVASDLSSNSMVENRTRDRASRISSGSFQQAYLGDNDSVSQTTTHLNDDDSISVFSVHSDRQSFTNNGSKRACRDITRRVNNTTTRKLRRSQFNL